MMRSLISFVCIVAIFFLIEITATDFIFSECQANKDSCQDCYIALVKLLLGNDGNVYNLSRAFFPPIVDPPDSVIVNYRFLNDTVDETDTWFWATSGVYFLHPMLIFPFISLLFGKYRAIYEQITTVTLNATECFGASDEYMTLLTQRLKIYIQEQTIYPEMDGSYVAMAVNSRTFKQMLMTRSMDIEPTSVFIACLIVIVASMILILVTVVILHYYFHETFKESGLNRDRKAAIVSSAIISFNRLVYFAALDACAVSYRSDIATKYPEYNFIHYDGQPGKLHAILYHIPLVLLLFDLLFLTPSLVCVVISLVGLCICRVSSTTTTEPQADKEKIVLQDKVYYCLIPVIVFFLFGILLHTPYIAMAYLSDPRHAASILLYYIVITFVEFGLLELTFRRIWFGKIDHGCAHNLSNRGRCALGTFIAVLLSLSVYVSTVTATMFFYLIPVRESIGRAPSQIVITYQTAFILVGGYIIYKVIIKKQNSVQRAIRACHKEWKSKPDHELLTEFYIDAINKMDKFLKDDHEDEPAPAMIVGPAVVAEHEEEP